MIYLTFICVVQASIAVAMLLVHRAAMRDHNEERKAWASERRELLNRIQRPDLVPVSSPPKPPSREEVERRQSRARALASVGTVTHAKRDEPGR